MRTKINLLTTLLLIGLCGTTMAQDYTLESIARNSLRKSGAIMNNEVVTGYYFFYRSDKSKSSVAVYEIVVLDQDLNEIASEYSDRLKVCKIDIDANQSTPPKYGIRGIPTLMLFKDGEVEATKVGALSKSQLQAFLDSNI